jgi:hypothetical protein
MVWIAAPKEVFERQRRIGSHQMRGVAGSMDQTGSRVYARRGRMAEDRKRPDVSPRQERRAFLWTREGSKEVGITVSTQHNITKMEFCQEEGVSVIIGTPGVAGPPWFARKLGRTPRGCQAGSGIVQWL